MVSLAFKAPATAKANALKPVAKARPSHGFPVQKLATDRPKNTTIAATDVLVLNHISGGTIGSYTLNAACGAGSAVIYVRNNTAGSLSEAIVIQFAVVKGVNA